MTDIQSFDDYKNVYEESVSNPDGFWASVAEGFTWKKKWDKVLEWDFTTPEIKWFQGAKLNITENCLDRHLETRGDQTAILWEPNDPEENSRSLTYRELHAEVCKFSNALKAKGIHKGDRVCIYMPMVPELAIAVLACARIGAVHSVVFAGFSAKSLSDRIIDAACKMVITSDGGYRGGKITPLKTITDEALERCSSPQNVVVLKRTGQEVHMQPGRDLWWHDVMEGQSTVCPAEEMDAEDMLFILYTSGSTGMPKGMVHTCAGYMVYTDYTFRNTFQYQDGDV